MGILNFPNTNLKYDARDAALVSFVLSDKKILILHHFFCVLYSA